MNEPTPHYLLTTQADQAEYFETGSAPGSDRAEGYWRFVLRPTDGSQPIEAADVEPDIRGERLDLLTVVRALESLDQPSRITLIGGTRYVRNGIQFALAEWRENQWRWEWFGQMVPVRDADLWQRMDRALQFHRVECGQRRWDARHGALSGPHGGGGSSAGRWADRLIGGEWIKYYAPALTSRCAACMETVFRFWQKVVGIRDQGSGVGDQKIGIRDRNFHTSFHRVLTPNP